MNGIAPASPLQPELLTYPEPTPMERDVARLVGILAGRGWMTAARILAVHPEWKNDRKVRTIASGSDGAVMSYPGSPGYHLTIEASALDREHAAAALRRQALEMGERASAILRAHHACHRPDLGGAGSPSAPPRCPEPAHPTEAPEALS